MLFKKLRQKPKELQFTTIRDYTGGLNTTDNDLNLDSRFQTILNNMELGDDGSLAIRPGTKLFRSLPIADGIEIIGEHYFANNIVSVTSDGRVWRTDGTGAAFLIFDDSFAAALPGAPAGWDATDYVSFNEFNSNLTIDNGVNKPLRVYVDMFVEYLSDDATGSNFFVPVARHSTTHGNFHVLSGDPFNPDVLFISSTGTIGVFEGAPNPNDGVNIILGARVTRGSSIIRGHRSFRDKLIVFFDECILVGTLGIYNSAGDHVPTFDDAIDQFGAQNHNAIVPFGDDVLFLDPFGVPFLSRAIFTSEVTPDRSSKLVEKDIHNLLFNLSEDTLTRRTFGILNKHETPQAMFFVPNDSNEESTTETVCFVQLIHKNSKERPWAIYRGWNWRCGCVSVGGRVFLAKGKNTFVLGQNNDPAFGDYNDYEDSWDDDTAFSDGHGFLIVNLDAYQGTRSGVPINFDGHTPWADFGKRMINKFTKYAAMDTRGKARFTLDMFVDRILDDKSVLGEAWLDGTLFDDDTGFLPMAEIPYLPALSMDFIGADAGAYGGSGYGQLYGDSRPTSHEQLYGWEAKCNIAKFRVHGYSREDLGLVSLSVAYNTGSIRR